MQKQVNTDDNGKEEMERKETVIIQGLQVTVNDPGGKPYAGLRK